jgi:hypothetical protein
LHRLLRRSPVEQQKLLEEIIPSLPIDTVLPATACWWQAVKQVSSNPSFLRRSAVKAIQCGWIPQNVSEQWIDEVIMFSEGMEDKCNEMGESKQEVTHPHRIYLFNMFRKLRDLIYFLCTFLAYKSVQITKLKDKVWRFREMIIKSLYIAVPQD